MNTRFCYRIIALVAFLTPIVASANLVATTELTFASGALPGKDELKVLPIGSGPAISDSKFGYGDLGAGAAGEAHASADVGILKASSTTDQSAGFLFGDSVVSRAIASFRDTVTIGTFGDLSVLNGTLGFADITVNYRWADRFPGFSGAYFGLVQLGIADSGGAAQEFHNTLDGSESGGENPLEVFGDAVALGADFGNFFSIRVPITIGGATPIFMALQTRTESKIGEAMFDAYGTAYWGGILTLRDSTGNEIPFTVTSASGVDYSKSFVPGSETPVPEPLTGSLLVSGLIALFHRRNKLQAGKLT